MTRRYHIHVYIMLQKMYIKLYLFSYSTKFNQILNSKWNFDWVNFDVSIINVCMIIQYSAQEMHGALCDVTFGSALVHVLLYGMAAVFQSLKGSNVMLSIIKKSTRNLLGSSICYY